MSEGCDSSSVSDEILWTLFCVGFAVSAAKSKSHNKPLD